MQGDLFKWCSFTGQQDPQMTSTVIEGAYSAALLCGVVLWERKEVTVSFTNTSVYLLSKWNKRVRDILTLANKWHQLQSDSKPGETNYIPKFVGARADEDADIIVELNGNTNKINHGHVSTIIIIDAAYSPILSE